MKNNALLQTPPAGHTGSMDTQSPTRIQLYARNRDATDAMYEDCLKATKSIEFEQYIVRDDEIGHKFMTMFAEKAKQGVMIRLLLDRVGSRSLYHSKLVRDIREHGGTVNFYNTIGWLNLFAPATWFPRNHTKTMLIDSEIVHIGSACLADNMTDWRDLHARITGILVGEIARDFSYVWRRAKGETNETRKNVSGDDPHYDYLIARPRFTPSPIYRELLRRIHGAQQRIYMATPYFLPPAGLRLALRKAAARGVDVRVILTEQTDVPLAVHTSRSYFRALLQNGIRLFSYQDTVYHAKYTAVDDSWATMGSTNLDYLSLMRNREANILIRDAATVRELRRQFDEDLKHSREILPDFWNHVPLHHKIIGYMGRAVKRML